MERCPCYEGRRGGVNEGVRNKESKGSASCRGHPPRRQIAVLAMILLFFGLVVGQVDGIRWLALGKATGPPWNKVSSASATSSGHHTAIHSRSGRWSSGALPSSVSAACGRARRNLGLTRAQAKLCRRAADAMPLVARAAAQTAMVCADLFKDRRWNCSSLELAPDLAPDLTMGTREQAFVYALASASVAFSVARACATGSLSACSCGATPREPPDGNFKWGGCGDNIKYGLQFGKAWADAATMTAPFTPGHTAGDKYGKGQGGPKRVSSVDNNVELGVVTEKSTRRRTGDRPMDRRRAWRANCTHVLVLKGETRGCRDSTLLRRRGGKGGREARIRSKGSSPVSDKEGERKQRKGGERRRKEGERIKGRHGPRRTLLSVVNLHNNRAGRRAIDWSVSTQCKCHGVSGSCNIKTCWKALPKLMDVGERLKRQYAVATEVVPGRGWVDRQDSLIAASTSNPGSAVSSLRLQHHVRGSELLALAPLAPPPGGRRRRLLQPAATAPAADFNDHHLIYVTKSPDYCSRDPSVGSQGTSGRWCNASSNGHDGCDSMCCGRGYRTIKEELVERCQCKYYPCCYVKCKTCRKWVERHQCN